MKSTAVLTGIYGKVNEIISEGKAMSTLSNIPDVV